MKINDRLKLVLIYEWGDRQIPIAEIRKPELIVDAKKEAIEKACVELRTAAGLDPIIAIDKDCELQRMMRMLNRLVREDKGCKKN
jgi:hypothetical protein